MVATLSKVPKFNLHDGWVERGSGAVFTQDESALSVAQFEQESWSGVLERAHALSQESTKSDLQDELEDPRLIENEQPTSDLEEPKEIVELSPAELDARIKEAEESGFNQAHSELAREYETRVEELTRQLMPVIENIDLLTRANEGVIEALANLAIEIGEKLARTTLNLSPVFVQEFIQNSIKSAERELGESGKMKLPKEWESFKDDLDLEGKFPSLAISYEEELAPGDLRVDFGGVGFEDFMANRCASLRLQLNSAGVGILGGTSSINDANQEIPAELEATRFEDDEPKNLDE